MYYPLKKGDTIAVVSPSWGGPSLFPHIYDKGINMLKELGFFVKEMSYARAKNEDIFLSPEKRAKDINDSFADKGVKMIIASIGGEDSIRILPYLNGDLIKNNPKIFMGFSDTTSILCYLSKLGNPCYYGPSIMAGISQISYLGSDFEEHIRNFLFDTISNYQYIPYSSFTTGFPDWSKQENAGKIKEMITSEGWNWIQGDSVISGKLWGGCFEVLNMLRGTDYWLYGEEWQNKVFFIEISGDNHPHIDDIKWTLRSFHSQGIFDKISAFLWGKHAGYTKDESRKINDMIRDFFIREVKNTKLPIIVDMDFGHHYPQHILPYNYNIIVDPANQNIKLSE